MNIKKYYLYQFFDELMPIYPVYLILFESKGLSIFEISVLLIIWAISTVVLEVPSGVLADHWSRRNLLILGSIMKMGCYVCWFFADGFLMFSLGFILWGTCSAFRSGSKEALIYDSLKKEQQEAKFDQVYGRGQFLAGVSGAIASFTGGFIAMYFGMQCTLIVSIIIGSITTIIAITLDEVNLYQENKGEHLITEQKMLKDELHFFCQHKAVIIVVLITILVAGTAGILDEYDPLIAKGFGISVGAVGVWTCMRMIITAFGNILAPYIKKSVTKKMNRQDTIYFMGGICIVAAILLGVSGGISQIWGMVFYGGYYFLAAVSSVIGEDYLQQQIEKEGRSTIHSLVSLFYNIFGILFFALLGAVYSATSLLTGIMFIAGYMIIVVSILLILHRKVSHINL